MISKLYSLGTLAYNQYGPPVWRKSEIGDAESGADIKVHE